MSDGQGWAALVRFALDEGGHDDLVEAVDALREAAATLARGGFAVRVDGALLRRVFADVALIVSGTGLIPQERRQVAADWLGQLVEAVAGFPKLVGGEEAAHGRAQLAELLAQGGDPDAAVDLRPDADDALGSLIYAQLQA